MSKAENYRDLIRRIVKLPFTCPSCLHEGPCDVSEHFNFVQQKIMLRCRECEHGWGIDPDAAIEPSEAELQATIRAISSMGFKIVDLTAFTALSRDFVVDNAMEEAAKRKASRDGSACSAAEPTPKPESWRDRPPLL